MEERIIIESENSYKKKLKTFTIVFVVLAVGSLICLLTQRTLMDILGDTLVRVLVYISIPTLLVSFIPAVVLLILYIYIRKSQLTVTDKRIYGKTSFGKQVDLPVDSISAIETSSLKGLAVATSSGKIKFLGISNRDSIYEEIKRILADRQSKETKTVSPATVTNIMQEQSSADELKKFKDLLDSGIITQEEFDAKKKQLLGL